GRRHQTLRRVDQSRAPEGREAGAAVIAIGSEDDAGWIAERLSVRGARSWARRSTGRVRRAGRDQIRRLGDRRARSRAGSGPHAQRLRGDEQEIPRRPHETNRVEGGRPGLDPPSSQVRRYSRRAGSSRGERIWMQASARRYATPAIINTVT